MRITADPRTKMDDSGYGRFFERQVVHFAEGLHDFFVDFRERVEQRKPEVAQAHADFIIDRRLSEPDFVGLPQRSDFGANIVFAFFSLFSGEGKAVEAFQLLRDAAALQENRLTGDLSRMSGEDGRDLDVAKGGERLLRRNPGGFHALQGSTK